MAAKNSIDLEHDPRSIIGIARVRRAARAGVRGLHRSRSTWRNGGGRTASPPRPRPSTSGRAASGASSCTGRTAATTRTASPIDEIVPPERIVYRHGGGDDVEPVQFSRRSPSRISERQDPAHLARHVPIGRRARPRDQGLRRRQGPGADHGAARRLCGGAWQLTRGVQRSMQRALQDNARKRAAQSSALMPASSRSASACACCHSGKALVSSARPAARDGQPAAALVFFVDRNLHQPAPFQRLELGGQRGAVHGEQRGDAADIRRLRPVERHQQRELAVGQVERRAAPRRSAAPARAPPAARAGTGRCRAPRGWRRTAVRAREC